MVKNLKWFFHIVDYLMDTLELSYDIDIEVLHPPAAMRDKIDIDSSDTYLSCPKNIFL